MQPLVELAARINPQLANRGNQNRTYDISLQLLSTPSRHAEDTSVPFWLCRSMTVAKFPFNTRGLHTKQVGNMTRLLKVSACEYPLKILTQPLESQYSGRDKCTFGLK